MGYFRAQDGSVFQSDNPEYYTECERLPNKAGREALAEHARAKLREMMAPNDTVYCVLRSRAASGMSREISFLIADPGNENSKGKPYIRDITARMVDAVPGWRIGRAGGIVMGGCGMDMGFSAVYTLSSTLWPNGTPEPHGVRNGEPDISGGYALRHSWL